MTLFRTRAIRSFVSALLFAVFLIPAAPALAARGVPSAVSYQGTLADSGGNPLGGTGTQYHFRFSLWDSPTVGAGSRLWPSSAPTAVELLVRQGSFSVDIGGAGYPDALDHDFASNSSTYLQVEVSPDGSSFETLSPRSLVTSSPFSQVSSRVSGLGQSSFGTTSPFASSILTAQSTSSSAVALTLFGSAGQTANILDVLSSTGSSLFAIGGGGNVGIGTSTPSEKLWISGNLGFDATGIIKFAGRSAQNVTQTIQTDSTDFLVVGTSSSGKGVKIINATFSASGTSDSQLFLQPGGGGAAAKVPLTVTGAASQTGDLTQWKNSAGGFLGVVTAGGNFGIGTTTPNSALSVVGTTTVNTRLVLPPSATAGIQLFSTGDNDGLATNERAGMYWSGNTFNIATERSGGTSRPIAISSTDGTLGSGKNMFTVFPRNTTSPTGGYFDLINIGPITASGVHHVRLSNPGGSGFTGTAGDNRMLSITPIINSSGTSANTDLLIERNQITTGSGEQNIIKAGTSTHAGMFVLRNTGLIGLGTSTLNSLAFTTLNGNMSGKTIGLHVENASSVYNGGQIRVTSSPTSYTDFFQGPISGIEGMYLNVAATNGRFGLNFNNSASSYFDTDGWVVRNVNTGNGQILLNRTSNYLQVRNAFNAPRVTLGTNGAVSGTLDNPGMLELYGVDNVKKVSINATTTSYLNTGANFGIGTTTPTTPLFVAGTTTMFGDLSLAPASVNGLNRQINFGASYNQPAILLYDAGTSNRFGWGLRAGNTQFFGTNSNVFTWNKGGDFQPTGTNELMRLDSSTGNLGIGSSSPTQKLTVAGGLSVGATGLGGYVNMVDSSNVHRWTAGIIPSGSPSAYGIYSPINGVTPFVITAGQNVGIGSTTPNAKLSVKGTGLTTGEAFKITDSADAPKFTVLDNGSATFTSAGASEPTLMVQNTNADSGGPRFTLYKNTASPAVNDFIGAINFQGVNNSLSGRVYSSISSKSKTVTASAEEGVLAFSNFVNGASTEVLTINEEFVGIGTTTPGAMLHVSSNNPTGLIFERTNSLNSTIEYRNTMGSMFAGISSTGAFGIGNSNNLAGAIFTVDPTTSRVGLGTTTPSAQLTTTGAVRFAALTGAGSNLVVDALGNVTVSSDERLKDISGNFTRGLEDVRKLSPITYHWKAETGYDTASAYTGFSAQNVQSAIPEAVATSANGFLNLADRPIIAALVNAVKELDLKVEELLTSKLSSLTELTLETLNVQNVNISGNVCVDGVCVTKEQFRNIFLQNGGSSAPIPVPAPAPTPEPEPEPSVPVPEEPVEATSTPEVIPEPVVEPVVEPEPAPITEPEPAPEPAPIEEVAPVAPQE